MERSLCKPLKYFFIQTIVIMNANIHVERYNVKYNFILFII